MRKRKKNALPECMSITVDFLVASEEPGTYTRRHCMHLFKLLGIFAIVLHSSMAFFRISANSVLSNPKLQSSSKYKFRLKK